MSKPPRHKILVADDEPSSRCILVRAVESLGHVALDCSSGLRALEILVANDDVRLLITDVMMPGMTGDQLLLAVRRHERLSSLPVILVSAAVRATELSHLLRLGASRFMSKPLDVVQLKKTISELLDRSDAPADPPGAA